MVHLSHFLKKHWWQILAGTILAGFVTEILNAYVFRWWIYHEPWTYFFFPPFPVGAPLIIGWAIMSSLAFFLATFIGSMKPRTRLEYIWIIAWIVTGFVIEYFNSNIWTTWHYDPATIWSALIVPILNFGIFVPVIGYGATGLITYWSYKYLLIELGKGKERDSVCWMKVQRKISAKYKNKRFYFCSGSCRKDFIENPEICARLTRENSLLMKMARY